MKLLIIYGAPAVGKLTVANEVAKLTGFKVFHNHLSIDAIQPIFAFGSESFMRLIELIRVETVAEAARQGVNIIYTFCYAKGIDEEHVEKIVQAGESNGAEVQFVLLTCGDDELRKRVVASDRRLHGKVNTIEMIEGFLSDYEMRSRVPYSQGIEIDNTDVSPEAVAERIIEHFELEEIGN